MLRAVTSRSHSWSHWHVLHLQLLPLDFGFYTEGGATLGRGTSRISPHSKVALVSRTLLNLITCALMLYAVDSYSQVLTFLLACVLGTMVILILAVAIITGVAYGYNYSMAEFITFGKSDVTVYMRRGLFSDEDADRDRPVILARRRQLEDLFTGEAVDIQKLTPDAGGEARVLADSWEQARDERKYDTILSKFTPRRKTSYVESKPTRSSLEPTRRVIENFESVFLDEKNQDQDDFHRETTKSKTVATKPTRQSPPTKLLDKVNLKTVFLRNENQNKDNFQKKTTKSKIDTVRTKTKFQLTARRVMDNFNSIYVDEYNQEQYDFDKETTKSKKGTDKTTKEIKEPDLTIRVSSKDYDTLEEEKYNGSEQNPEKNTDDRNTEEEDEIINEIQEEEKILNDDKAKQSSDRRIPDVKIRVGNINHDITSEPIKTTGITRLDIVDYSETEEEEIIFNKVQEQEKILNKDKAKQSSDTRIPDVKIRVGNANYKMTSAKIKTTEKTRINNVYTEQEYETREPDIKVILRNKDNYGSDKNNKNTVVEPLENPDYEEQRERKALKGRFRFGNRLKFEEGATPYKVKQPPHLYREEDEEVMYKPV